MTRRTPTLLLTVLVVAGCGGAIHATGSVSAPARPVTGADFSEPSTVIAYQRNTSRGSGIGTYDTAARRRHVLTHHTGWQDRAPTWDRNGRRIAFARSTDGGRSSRIYVMRRDGTHVHRVTSGRLDYRPAWSPNGRWIAYQATSGIRIVRPDGTRDHPVRGAAGAASRPAWSADGSRLSYTVGEESSVRIIVQHLDGSGRHQLARGWSSAWSPAGHQVAITGVNGGVYTVPAEGGKVTFLAKGFEAGWNADGSLLAYTRWPDDNHFQIWMMRPDGTHRTLLLRDAEAPAWDPSS